MIYTLANTIEIGKPCRTVDANGTDCGKVVECDTETGRVLRYVTDADGNLSLPPGCDELERETVLCPAPLTPKWITHNDR